MIRSNRSWARLRAVLALSVAITSGGGCAVRDLAFVQDDTVAIDSPSFGETVELPLTLKWSSEKFDGDYVVFFDRSPMRPGRDLLSLVDDADPCRLQEPCPSENWLLDRDIYITSDTSLTVDTLPDNRRNSRDQDRHAATIVLLDEDGRRVGESAFIVEFAIDRNDS